MLIGTYHHQLDAKNRFRIPTKFKANLGEDIVITKGTNGCLYLFKAEEIEKNVFDKMQDISMFDETAQKSFRLLLSSAHEVETDNQGRSLLPASLKEYAGIEKNIVSIGVGRRVEIWEEERWAKYSKDINFDQELSSLKDYGV